jgi:hypothetical protein
MEILQIFLTPLQPGAYASGSVCFSAIFRIKRADRSNYGGSVRPPIVETDF